MDNREAAIKDEGGEAAEVAHSYAKPALVEALVSHEQAAKINAEVSESDERDDAGRDKSLSPLKHNPAAGQASPTQTPCQ